MPDKWAQYEVTAQAPQADKWAQYEVKQPAPIAPVTQATPTSFTQPVTDTVSQYHPGVMDRVRSAFPVIGRIEQGLSGPAQTTAQALAKPSPEMSDERAVAPEQAMTPEERQAHPIATGAGEFAGGMTTPDNMLLMAMSGGPKPTAISRTAGGLFGTQMLMGAIQQAPDVIAALKRGDTSEAERIATHIGLGLFFGGTATKHAALGETGAEGRAPVPVWEEFRRRGKAIADYMRQAKSSLTINDAATILKGKTGEMIDLLDAKLKQDGQNELKPFVDADNAQAQTGSGYGSIVPARTVSAIAKAQEDTGYEPNSPERDLIESLSTDPADAIAQGLGYHNADMARSRMGAAFDSYAQRVGQEIGGSKGGMTLEEALQKRTKLGTMAAKLERSNNAKGASLFWSAYTALGEDINARIQELKGQDAYDSNGNPLLAKEFDNYNKNFKASFELRKGFTGDVRDPIIDRHNAVKHLENFSDADVREVAAQMEKKGLDSSELFKAQRNAKALVDADKSIKGKLSKGLYRLASTSPAEALAPMGIYMMSRAAGLYGFAPYLLATMAGKISGDVATRAEAGRVFRSLNIPENQKFLQLRTEVPESPDVPEEQPNRVEAVKSAKARRTGRQ